MAGTAGFFSNGPVPWMDNDTEMNNLYRDLELGTVLTLFYSKKSQRPERRTFQVKLETRTIIWTRGTDKIEGESEYSANTNMPVQISMLLITRCALNVKVYVPELVGQHAFSIFYQEADIHIICVLFCEALEWLAKDPHDGLT